MQEDVLAGAEFEFEMGSLALRAHDLEGEGGARVARTARVLHEYDHLVRLLGTSYGLVRHGLASHYVDYFLRSLESSGGLGPFRADWQSSTPVVQTATPAKVLERYLADDRESLVMRAQAFRKAIGLLDGGGLGAVGAAPLIGWAEYVAGLMDASEIDETRVRAQLHQLWGTRPRRPNRLIYIDGNPLTVKDILEYLGIVVELAYQVQFGSDEAAFPAELSERTYLQVLNAVRTFLPRALDAEKMVMAQEIEGLFELALWVPLWPGITADELPEHAVDLIPSYRLGAVLDACEELSLPLTLDASVDDVQEVSGRVAALQRAICQHRGWATPDAIADRWDGGLRAVEAAGEQGWSRCFFHHPRSRRVEWTRQLVRECGHHPVSGAMLAGSRHYGTIGFPTILDLKKKELGYQPNLHVTWPEADRHFQRLDALLFTATTYAPVEAHWRWLPDAVREEALSSWARTPKARAGGSNPVSL